MLKTLKVWLETVSISVEVMRMCEIMQVWRCQVCMRNTRHIRALFTYVVLPKLSLTIPVKFLFQEMFLKFETHKSHIDMALRTKII